MGGKRERGGGREGGMSEGERDTHTLMQTVDN